jgi:hypothetical protein
MCVKPISWKFNQSSRPLGKNEWATNLDVFKFCVLGEPVKHILLDYTHGPITGCYSLIESLHHPEQRHHDIHSTVPLPPQFRELVHRTFNIGFVARLDDRLDEHRMRLVADFEDRLGGDEAEAARGALEVVDRLPHVAFGCEDEGCEAVIVVFDLTSAY